MEQSDERKNSLKGFCEYLSSRISKQKSSKQKYCSSITLTYEKYLISKGRLKFSACDKEIVKALKQECEVCNGLITYDNLFVSAVCVYDKLEQTQEKPRDMLEDEVEAKNLYSRLHHFSKYLMTLCSKSSSKKLSTKAFSYEKIYDEYLKHYNLQNEAKLDKSVIQSIKSASNGMWVSQRNLPLHTILTDVVIASNRAFSSYGKLKMEYDSNQSKEIVNM